MRIRLRSIPPLPSLKAWFELPSAMLSEESTIKDLKQEVARKLLNNEKDTVDAIHILLELDDFELLDDSSISVIRENDLLVCVRHEHRDPSYLTAF